MMKINHIASGSSGNAVLVSDGSSSLLLDAGISYRKIARHITPTKLAGALVTHEHMDHCKAVNELVRRGISIYMSKGTALEVGHTTPFVSILQHLIQTEIGSWKVLPFNVRHDAAEPLGFFIMSRETGEKAVYIADSAYIELDFPGVNYWIIEANYSDSLLEESDDPGWLKDRIRNSHFSFENLKKFFRTSDMSKTEEIHLIHLSNRNSNEEEFKAEIQREFGVPVYTISDSDLSHKSRVPQNTAPGLEGSGSFP